MVHDLQYYSKYTSELNNLNYTKVMGPLMVSMDGLQGTHEASEIPWKLCVFVLICFTREGVQKFYPIYDPQMVKNYWFMWSLD